MADLNDDDEEEIIAEYDFAEDAMGLGDFVSTVLNGKDIADHEICIDVRDDQHRPAKSAKFVRDGFGVRLMIEFDRDFF